MTDGAGENDSLSDSYSHSSSPSDEASMGDKLLQKLQKGMNESLAVNYFKSKRRDVLLSKNGSNRDKNGGKNTSPSLNNNNNNNIHKNNDNNVSNTLHGNSRDKFTSNNVIDLVKQSYYNGDTKHSSNHGTNDDDEVKVLSPVSLRDNVSPRKPINGILSNVNTVKVTSKSHNGLSRDSETVVPVNASNSTSKSNRQATVPLNTLINGRSSHLNSPVTGKQDTNSTFNQLKQGKKGHLSSSSCTL